MKSLLWLAVLALGLTPACTRRDARRDAVSGETVAAAPSPGSPPADAAAPEVLSAAPVPAAGAVPDPRCPLDAFLSLLAGPMMLCCPSLGNVGSYDEEVLGPDAFSVSRVDAEACSVQGDYTNMFDSTAEDRGKFVLEFRPDGGEMRIVADEDSGEEFRPRTLPFTYKDGMFLLGPVEERCACGPPSSWPKGPAPVPSAGTPRVPLPDFASAVACLAEALDGGEAGDPGKCFLPGAEIAISVECAYTGPEDCAGPGNTKKTTIRVADQAVGQADREALRCLAGSAGTDSLRVCYPVSLTEATCGRGIASPSRDCGCWQGAARHIKVSTSVTSRVGQPYIAGLEIVVLGGPGEGDDCPAPSGSE